MCISLHGKCLARAGWTIDDNVTIFTSEEGITQLSTCLVEYLTLSALTIKNLLEVEIAFTIVKVVIGENFEALLGMKNLDHFFMIFLSL